MKGLEPPRLSAPDPKSGTATNYATSAIKISVVKWNVTQITGQAHLPVGTAPITPQSQKEAQIYGLFANKK